MLQNWRIREKFDACFDKVLKDVFDVFRVTLILLQKVHIKDPINNLLNWLGVRRKLVDNKSDVG